MEFLQYGFISRGLEAGIIVALIAPFIGIFLVLRRYSLIADTLSHVSLAGVAMGLYFNLNPVFTAIGTTLIASFAIERLRLTKKIYGETALALFLSGSLAAAVVLLSAAHGFGVNLFNYLFGSIVTVTRNDVYIIFALGAGVLLTLILFFKELVFITFDEEAATVAGIPTRSLNLLFITLAAITVSVSIPIIGVLLISALIVIPVTAALQLKLSFVKTILVAQCVAVLSVIVGVYTSFLFNISTGGCIVLLTIFFFILSFLTQKIRK